jgi:uncharacterized protein
VKLVLWIAGSIGAVYAALCAWLFVAQDSFVFPRAANDPTLVGKYRTRRIAIPTADTTLEGWWIENQDRASGPIILYFGGNAEDVLHSADNVARLNARAMLATNYRGYGGTPGAPSETALYADALVVYDYAVKRAGGNAQDIPNIVAMGRSLGSGVAVYVAAHRPLRGVVLITPYDSMLEVAARHFPYFPVRRLLKHSFSSAKRAVEIRIPALIVAAERDTVVPATHARELFAAWRGPKEIRVLENSGHNDLDLDPRYYSFINEFLDTLRLTRT